MPGPFQRDRYAATYLPPGSTDAQVHPIRVQPETLALTATTGGSNDGSSAAFTSPISCEVSRSKRSLGLHARKFRLKLADTPPPPVGFATNSVIELPILTQAFYDAGTIGDAYTYLEGTWTLVGKSAEIVK